MAVRSIIVSGGNGIGYTKEVDSSADYSSIANNTYFKDISLGVGGMILYKSNTGEILEIYGSLAGKQDLLVSGVNIKTINGASILGSGDVSTEFPQSKKIFVDSTYGIDATGRGSQVKPYLTPEFALSDTTNIGTFIGDTTNNSYTITNILNTSSISVGDFLYGTGLTTYNTRVIAKTLNSVTINYPATATGTGITVTTYTPYTLILSGNFIATSNWYKLGMWFDCGNSYITYGAFTLFDVNTEGYVPLWINGGYWNGSTASSKFISSLSKSIMPDIYVNIKDYKSLFTGYNIETGRATGRQSQNNIKCPNFVCVAGYVANMSDVWNTIWDGYCYGTLGGIISQAQNLVFTGLVETPSSVWSLATANCNMTVNGHIYGGLLMYSSHGTFNGDAYGVTNQLAGQTYSSPVVMNGSIKNMSGALTVDGCHVIINGGCHQSVVHTSGSLDIMRMAGQSYTQSGSNYPHAVFHHAGGEQASAIGGEHIGLSYINLNATNGWLTVLSGYYGNQLIIASGSTFVKKGGYMNAYISTLAGTLINHGYIKNLYRSGAITGKLINKGVIETWSDKGNDGADIYQPCIVVSTGTFIQDGGQLICPIGFPGTKSGLIRKTGTGKVIFKNQPLIKVANGLAPIEILGSSANGNISNFGCITNCADGFGLLNTFSDTSYNGTHYPIVDLVGGSLYEDPTNNIFDYTNSAYLH